MKISITEIWLVKDGKPIITIKEALSSGDSISLTIPTIEISDDNS